MTEMFGEAWPPMSVPDLAPDDDDDYNESFISHNSMSSVSLVSLLVSKIILIRA